jgi:hypothetical protein
LVTLISELESRVRRGEGSSWVVVAYVTAPASRPASDVTEPATFETRRKVTRSFVNVLFRPDLVKSLALVTLPAQEWTLSARSREINRNV